MKVYAFLALAVIAVLLASGCVDDRQIDGWPVVRDFDTCVAAGHPVMESYPRQCSDGTNTWTEEACFSDSGMVLTMADAYQIASQSGCALEGELARRDLDPTYFFCNEVTGTVWIELNPFEFREGCSPACVVDMASRTAEINWRCTGLIPPEA